MLEGLQRWLTGYAPAPVVLSRNEVQENQDFRLPGDPLHLIRVRQNPPQAADRLFSSIKVAGISRTRETVDLFVAGRSREIELRHGAAGPNDLTSIQVVGLWADQFGILHRKKLGWLSVETISEIERVVCVKFCKKYFRKIQFLSIDRRRACGNVGKLSVLGEAFPRLRGNPRLLRISSEASFPSGLGVSFFWFFFFLSPPPKVFHSDFCFKMPCNRRSIS